MNVALYKNSVLRHLDAGVVQRLGLRAVRLELNHELERPGQTITTLYFIEEGVGSMTVTMQDGVQVEVGMFGYESVVGVSGLMGVRRSLNRVYMQMAGRGFACSLASAAEEFRRFGRFHELALRYVQAQLTQSSQSAACNATHEVEQRLARWLLICADRANEETYAISQEFLSYMLGISRPSVSIAAGGLKQQGLIDYKRGLIQILDPAGLEKKACECYHVVKKHLDNVADFDTGFVV